MDKRVIAASLLKNYNQSQAASGQRTNLTDEEIRVVTMMASKATAARAARQWNSEHPHAQICEKTVSSYLAYFNLHKRCLRTNRGRHVITSADDETNLLNALAALRQAGKSITAPDVCCMMIGIVNDNNARRALLAINGGPLIFSESWGQKWLKENGFTKRHATTDRAIASELIVVEGAKFFSGLKRVATNNKIDKHLTFNMDEFFVLLDHNRQWTWHKVVRGQPIILSTMKLGFTASIALQLLVKLYLFRLFGREKQTRFTLTKCTLL